MLGNIFDAVPLVNDSDTFIKSTQSINLFLNVNDSQCPFFAHYRINLFCQFNTGNTSPSHEERIRDSFQFNHQPTLTRPLITVKLPPSPEKDQHQKDQHHPYEHSTAITSHSNKPTISIDHAPSNHPSPPHHPKTPNKTLLVNAWSQSNGATITKAKPQPYRR